MGSRFTRFFFPYLKHSSSPLTNVRNGFKSFLSPHILLLFTQWRVYIFLTLPLQLFIYGARDFPASFPSRYAHKRLSFASAPLFFHDVGCVCVTVSEKWLKVWCNVPLVSLKTIRRDYARCLTFLKRLFFEIRWDTAVMRINFLFSDHAIGLQFLKDVGLICSKLQCNSCGRDMTWHADPTRLKAFLQPYNRQEDYEYHLARYIFAARWNALGVSEFTQFLAIAESTDWSSLPTTVTSPSGATWLTAVCPRETAASRYTGMSFPSRSSFFGANAD
jgi:hypothetical protein